MVRSFTVALAAGALCALGCAKGPRVSETDPFIGSPDALRGKRKIYAVASVAIPDGMPNADSIRVAFATKISEKLRRKSHSIFEPEQYETVWQGVSDEIGGLKDPETGLRDDKKTVEATVLALKRLKAGFEIDAVLVPTIEVVEAPFYSGRAIWDGTHQSVKTGGPVREFMAGSPDGTLGALSLRVSVYDPGGHPIYSKRGGIEVLTKTVGKEFVMVPRNTLFRDDDRNQQAVDIAIDDLLQ